MYRGRRPQQNFAKNIINKKSYEQLVQFVIYGHSCLGLGNFKNFQNITRAHIPRNVLVFRRILILYYYFLAADGHHDNAPVMLSVL